MVAITTTASRRWALKILGSFGLLTIAAPLAKGAPAPRRKILVVGDSMIAGALGLYLARSLAQERDQQVLRRGKSSSGLARPDFFDWIEEGSRLAKEFRPDASVVMFGGNDVQGLRMGKDEWIRWHEPGWNAEYARRVAEFCDILAPAGQHLFWVGMPVMRPPKFHSRVQRINTIVRAEMAIRRNSTFIDTWEVLAAENGGYADRVAVLEKGKKRRTLVRAGDGIHLTRAGAQILSGHVLGVMDRELREA